MDKLEEIITKQNQVSNNQNQDKNILSKQKNIQSKDITSNNKDRLNWLSYLHFLREEFSVSTDILNKTHSKEVTDSEFSLFIKGLIKRQDGELEKSTDLLKKCYNYNINDIALLKEIGKNLFLTGKYKLAIDIYDEAIEAFPQDWECFHYKGIASMNDQSFEMAQACFEKALTLNLNESTLIQFGKLYLLNDDTMTAIEKYKEALKLNPDNPDLLTSVGALYLKEGMIDEAINFFSEATKIDSFFSNALIGLGSLYQEKGEFELALAKYKLSSNKNPNSPIVWNNLGLCFFAKRKYIAAATCLKKAIYLDPFQWIINFNLGLIYIFTSQYTSAYNFMNAAANLKPNLAIIYMYLGVILSNLGDISQAMVYYDKSLEIESNYLTLFNYTVSLINNDMLGNARSKFSLFVKAFNDDTEDKEYKEEVMNMSNLVKEELKKLKQT